LRGEGCGVTCAGLVVDGAAAKAPSQIVLHADDELQISRMSVTVGSLLCGLTSRVVVSFGTDRRVLRSFFCDHGGEGVL